MARYALGVFENTTGNIDRAIKHWLIAVGCGQNSSLKSIQELYSKGHATKEVYTAALQAYQEYLSDIKSVQRDDAAAAKAKYRYY